MKKHTSYIILIYSFLLINTSIAQIGEVVFSFNAPAENPTGLAWDGQFLWNADATTNRIYQINPETGAVIYSVPGPAGAVINGLTWDGSFLWCCDRENDQLCKININDSSVVQTIGLETGSARGLTFDGTYLWYQDSGKKSIYKIDISNGSYIDTLVSPGGYNRGLAWDGNYLWSCDRDKNEFYLMDSNRGSVITIISAPGDYTYGLTYDGEFLWNTDYNNGTIYKISVQGTEKFHIFDPLQVNIRYSATIRNTGSGTMDLQTFLACPHDLIYQTLDDSLVFNTPPQSYFTDIYDQQIAYYQNFVQPGEQKLYQWMVPTTLFNIRFFLHPDSIGTLADIPQSIIDLYTRNGEKYDITNPRITMAVQEAIGDETNLYWQVRKLHDFVIEKIYYLNDSEWATAPGVLINGHGSCSEYSFLFIALCRAAGIPARYEAGGHLRDTIPYEDTVFHRWQQVYFPNYGWVPIDCTWDDKEYPCNQARYFGAMSNEAFTTTIGGGGEYGLWWTYNVANSSSGGEREREKLMEWLPYETAVELDIVKIPENLFLSYNYPNPFNTETNILYKLTEPGKVRIKIFNQLGQLILQETTLQVSTDWCNFHWNGLNDDGIPATSGIYFYQINRDAYYSSGKMLLIR